MKKRNNKVIVLALAGVIFVSLLVVFILNYSKDDSSFSILEKKWINDNASSVIDVSIYNDIPIYGKNGSGVSFDLLDSFDLDNPDLSDSCDWNKPIEIWCNGEEIDSDNVKLEY